MDTIKVNRKSWHYWLYDLVSINYTPDSLCQYIRRVVLGAIVLTVASMLTIIVILITLYFYIVAIALVVGYSATLEPEIFTVSLFLNGALWYALLTTAIETYESKLYYSPVFLSMNSNVRVSIPTPSFLSLLWRYVKAAKQKVCPLIDVID